MWMVWQDVYGLNFGSRETPVTPANTHGLAISKPRQDISEIRNSSCRIVHPRPSIVKPA